jgi:hypothetical protein
MVLIPYTSWVYTSYCSPNNCGTHELRVEEKDEQGKKVMVAVLPKSGKGAVHTQFFGELSSRVVLGFFLFCHNR